MSEYDPLKPLFNQAFGKPPKRSMGCRVNQQTLQLYSTKRCQKQLNKLIEIQSVHQKVKDKTLCDGNVYYTVAFTPRTSLCLNSFHGGLLDVTFL